MAKPMETFELSNDLVQRARVLRKIVELFIHNNFNLTLKNMLRYFSSKLSVFLELRSRETVCFLQQIVLTYCCFHACWHVATKVLHCCLLRASVWMASQLYSWVITRVPSQFFVRCFCMGLPLFLFPCGVLWRATRVVLSPSHEIGFHALLMTLSRKLFVLDARKLF